MKLIAVLAMLLMFVTCMSGMGWKAKARAGSSSSGDEVIDFAGGLERGRSYRAEVVYDEGLKRWRTAIPIKLPFHHAGSIEWENLSEFDELTGAQPTARSIFVFKVVSKRVVNVGGNRWNTTYVCRIISHQIRLIGKCSKIRSGRTRLMSWRYTFEVVKVLEGVYREREVTFQVFGNRYGLEQRKELEAVCPDEGNETSQKDAREVELTLIRYARGMIFVGNIIEPEAIKVKGNHPIND